MKQKTIWNKIAEFLQTALIILFAVAVTLGIVYLFVTGLSECIDKNGWWLCMRN